MIYCQNCRQLNQTDANFCRQCGFRIMQAAATYIEEKSVSTRPYMWKTDELSVSSATAQKTVELRSMPPAMPNYSSGHLANANFVAGYRCPFCGTQNLPFIKRRISTAGWITFAVLLAMTGIFFWIGLLIRENVQVCSVCHRTLT